MCLIIHRPAGRDIPRDWLGNGLKRNPDGWGIMAARNGSILVARGLRRASFFRALRRYDGMELFIHFRFATHGAVGLKNCHPFVICKGEYALMHNGVIDCVPNCRRGRSDTRVFAQDYLAPWIMAQGPTMDDIRADIEFAAGGWNRVVVLRRDGSHIIANRETGDDVRGLWLSSASQIAPIVPIRVVGSGRYRDYDPDDFRHGWDRHSWYSTPSDDTPGWDWKDGSLGAISPDGL